MTVFPKHALAQGSQLLAALFPQFSTETSRMPFIAAREGNEASARVTGWVIYYIWKTCWHIENVSMAERPTCRRSRHRESRSVCPAQLQAMPISSLLHHSGGSFGAKIMLGCLQMRCAHGCDVLTGAMCSWICLSTTDACRPEKILSCPSPVPRCVI